VQYGARSLPDSQMGTVNTKVVGTLTHADAPQITPRTAPRIPYAFITLYNNTHTKLFFASATPAGQSRVREQIRVALKTPLLSNKSQLK
jgi:hypothetical protein